MAFARPGDVLTVWRLDRLGQSLSELVKMIGELQAAGNTPTHVGKTASHEAERAGALGVFGLDGKMSLDQVADEQDRSFSETCSIAARQ